MRDRSIQTLRRIAWKSTLWLKIVVLVLAGLAPVLLPDSVNAAQLTPRRVTIGSSQSNVSTTYKFDFRMPTATAVQGIIFEFCTTPLGTCTKPNAMDVFTSAAVSAQDFDVATAFTVSSTASNDCNIAGTTADTKVCVTRTAAGSESAAPDEKSLTLSGLLNPTLTGVYMTVYVRIGVYSTNTFTTVSKVHEGTVAAGIVKQLNATGRVAERLLFCVGALQDEDITGETLPSDCDTGFPSATNIDMGIIDNLSVTAAPVTPSTANANLSNDRYGILMLNTNASGGVVVTFFPEQATNVSASDTDQLRSFRVLPTDCSSTTSSVTDQCFVSASSSGSSFSAGTEDFGMAIACIDTTQGSTSNFKPANGATISTAYDGDYDAGTNATGLDESTQGGIANNCENESYAGYTWGFDDTGTPALLASTATSTNKVVDDEIIKLRFGAAAAATTPTGTYVVVITYIATPTF